MLRVMLIAGALALAGCATITRGPETKATFNSNPPGATVQTSNGYECVTPCYADEVRRKEEFTATFTKPGYVPQTVLVQTLMADTGALGMAGSVALLGVFGFIIDSSSGAALKHCPDPVNVTLRRVGSPGPATNPVQTCEIGN